MANWKLDQNCFQMYPGIVCYSCDKVVWLFGEMSFCLNRCLGCVYVSPLGRRLPVSSGVLCLGAQTCRTLDQGGEWWLWGARVAASSVFL